MFGDVATLALIGASGGLWLAWLKAIMERVWTNGYYAAREDIERGRAFDPRDDELDGYVPAPASIAVDPWPPGRPGKEWR